MSNQIQSGAPSVAISVLHYGSEEKTAAALESLAKLEYPNFHIFLVDQTLKLSLKIPANVTVIVPERNLGFAGGNNLALERIIREKYDYALLFNNDATATPDLLDLLVETMDRHPKAAAAAPTVIWPDNRVWYGGGDYLPHQGRVWHQNADADYAQMMKAETGERKVSFVTGCCLLLRVADLSRIGLLDDTFFMYWEDADWCVRAQRSGYELYYEPRATVIHATSSSYGVNSPRYLYYTFRNNLLFIKRYTPWYWKPLAWGVEKLQVWKELIKLFTRYRRDYGTYLRDIWLALYHHLRGRYGEL